LFGSEEKDKIGVFPAKKSQKAKVKVEIKDPEEQGEG